MREVPQAGHAGRNCSRRELPGKLLGQFQQGFAVSARVMFRAFEGPGVHVQKARGLMRYSLKVVWPGPEHKNKVPKANMRFPQPNQITGSAL